MCKFITQALVWIVAIIIMHALFYFPFHTRPGVSSGARRYALITSHQRPGSRCHTRLTHPSQRTTWIPPFSLQGQPSSRQVLASARQCQHNINQPFSVGSQLGPQRPQPHPDPETRGSQTVILQLASSHRSQPRTQRLQADRLSRFPSGRFYG